MEYSMSTEEKLEFCVPYEYRNSCGIYSITNKTNGKMLIGSSVCFSKRFRVYKYDLKIGRCTNKYLLRSYNKSKNNFKMELINICDKKDLLQIEDYYIKSFDTLNSTKGYNLQLASRPKGMTGRKLTEEHKKKISRLGKAAPWMSIRLKNNKLALGHKLTNEHKKIISVTQTGNKNALNYKQSSEHIEKRLISSAIKRSLYKGGV